PFDLTFFTFGTPTCNISNSAISNISCNDNGTTTDDTDDYITFDLNPVGSTLGTNYNVSVSSGSISPTTAAYGSVTTFTLQNGSAGAGNVTVALTDDTDGTCTLNQLITDPGSCMSGSCTELFISEYVEGSGNNKYIEIYNPTNGSINLSGYQLATYFNGNSTPSTLALSGSIGSYSTYVIENSSANPGVTSDLSTNDTVMTFNGNDVIALQTNGGTNIDVIGTIGSSATFAANTTLRRKSTVQIPNTTYSSSEWEVYGQDTVSDLG